MKIKYNQEELLNVGIYAIFCKVSNNFYIGSTAKSFKYRLDHHLSELKSNRHHSKYLQHSWNKYTESDFEFFILEVIPKKEILDKKYILDVEQMWLDYFSPTFNTCKTAYSPLGIKRSAETRAKMAARKQKHPVELVWETLPDGSRKRCWKKDPKENKDIQKTLQTRIKIAKALIELRNQNQKITQQKIANLINYSRQLISKHKDLIALSNLELEGFISNK